MIARKARRRLLVLVLPLLVVSSPLPALSCLCRLGHDGPTTTNNQTEIRKATERLATESTMSQHNSIKVGYNNNNATHKVVSK